jgi:hypothetical protein
MAAEDGLHFVIQGHWPAIQDKTEKVEAVDPYPSVDSGSLPTFLRSSAEERDRLDLRKDTSKVGDAEYRSTIDAVFRF